MALWTTFGTHVGFESNQSTNILSQFRRSVQRGMRRQEKGFQNWKLKTVGFLLMNVT
jgi:hypothetical protein